MADYINTYVLTDNSVEVGGEMSSYFSMTIGPNGRVPYSYVDPNLTKAIYVYPPYHPIDQRYSGGRKIVLIVRSRTGFDNPYINSIFQMVNEWNARNPSKRVWTSTFGDDRTALTSVSTEPPAIRQARIDQMTADLLNEANFNAQVDFVQTFSDQYYKLMVIGWIMYYLTEEYEAAVAKEQAELNTLTKTLPDYAPVAPPPQSVPLTLKFASLMPELPSEYCAIDFGERNCGVLRNAALNGDVRIGETICLVTKDAAAEQRVLALIDSENSNDSLGYMVAPTYDQYCRDEAMKCGEISERRCTYDTFDMVVMA